MLLIVLMPLFVIIALLIVLEDGPPIFHRQSRPGKNDVLFELYKFRTMKMETPEIATHLLRNPDQYLLRSGRMLRKLSLDELPNILNVIKGDLNYVGPRPALYNQYDLISLRQKYGINRIKPGITGWAQVNGRDENDIDRKIELDQWYLDNNSKMLDMKILFLTFTKVLKMKNVSH